MSGSNGGHNPANPKLTPDQVDDVLRRHDEGETWTALAVEYGVTVAALIYHQTKSNRRAASTESMPASSHPATDADLAAILTTARHASGVADLRDLLETLGLTPRRVTA